MNNSHITTTLATGLTINRVINGLWQVADLERLHGPLPLQSTLQSLGQYAAAGLTTFDMADHYGDAEVLIGHFRRQYPHPNHLKLLTKWVPPPQHLSRGDVRIAVTRALDRLGLEQLDLLQFHAWNYAHPAWLEQLFWLNELRQEGLINHLGLTNFDSIHLHMVVSSGITIASNQVCYSLLDQRASQTMASYCASQGIGLLAFGTLAGGFLSDRWFNQPEPTGPQLNTWSLMKYKRFIDTAGGWVKFQQLLSTLNQVARRHGLSIAQIATRYILDSPGVAAVIIGVRLGENVHIQDNLQTLHISLKPEDHDDIKQALALLSPIPGDCGDEYRKPPFLTASGDLSHHLHDSIPPYQLKTSGVTTHAYSGTVWEDLAGYCRAVRRGQHIFVSGTTATLGQTLIGGIDAAAQTHFIIDKIEGAIQALGGTLQDVVRTRVFIKNMGDWEVVARAHGQRFGQIHPVNTLVQAGLIGSEYLVEIEAEALLTN